MFGGTHGAVIIAVMRIRTMISADRDAVAELICVSTNHYYQTHGRPAIFGAGDDVTTVFFDVYESLDPGCGLIAENEKTGRLMGSCFYHPRETHVSLGIMNVHPNHTGKGVARALLDRILEIADERRKPTRLVSSALNLDSFSLYSRAGFVPRTAYQDMLITIPGQGIGSQAAVQNQARAARAEDVKRIGDLEQELAGIRRDKDYRYFIDNALGFWRSAILEGAGGRLEGYLASSLSSGCNMIGPGFARSAEAAIALIAWHLDQHRGRTPVVLVPVEARAIVEWMYKLGAKNCELHFTQVRGPFTPFAGINLPSFLPETA